jgi:hypothetical protein
MTQKGEKNPASFPALKEPASATATGSIANLNLFYLGAQVRVQIRRSVFSGGVEEGPWLVLLSLLLPWV